MSGICHPVVRNCIVHHPFWFFSFLFIIIIIIICYCCYILLYFQLLNCSYLGIQVLFWFFSPLQCSQREVKGFEWAAVWCSIVSSPAGLKTTSVHIRWVTLCSQSSLIQEREKTGFWCLPRECPTSSVAADVFARIRVPKSFELEIGTAGLGCWVSPVAARAAGSWLAVQPCWQGLPSVMLLHGYPCFVCGFEVLLGPRTWSSVSLAKSRGQYLIQWHSVSLSCGSLSHTLCTSHTSLSSFSQVCHLGREQRPCYILSEQRQDSSSVSGAAGSQSIPRQLFSKHWPKFWTEVWGEAGEGRTDRDRLGGETLGAQAAPWGK